MELWKFIAQKLESENNIMLLVVIESNGSSPGRQGFKMAVTDKKELAGSVGGGIMEFDIVELAYTMLQLGKSGTFIKKQVHKTNSVENTARMMCSGDQTIAMTVLDKNKKDLIHQILNSIENPKPGILKLSPKGLSFQPGISQQKAIIAEIHNEANWEYRELLNLKNLICIIGAGHVSLALSKIMKDLDFNVEVFDDRNEITTLENNKFADKKYKVDYNEIDKFIPQGENVYVVIMTFEHQSDQDVLVKLADKKFKYLGLMGSVSKISAIYENTGIDKKLKDFKHLHAPVGIPIHSKTPVEIAVSIAGEIIKVKNSME
ncbi:MAG: XdhC family protein [Bacteroidales bacterium]